MNDKSVLSISKICKSYWTSFRNDSIIRVVDNLTIDLLSGESFGLIGPNGAGKTTTVKMIVGLTVPDSGQIKIFDQLSDKLEVRKKIGFMPENPNFYAHLTAFEFLLFIANLFNLPKATILQTIEKTLSQVGLLEVKNKPVKGFSKGMRQRLGLAQTLINDPDLLILDEPLDGLDPLGRADIKDLLISMKKRGKTILLSSHILSDIEEICDRVGIIDKGKLIAEGKISEIIPKGKNLEEIFVQTIRNT